MPKLSLITIADDARHEGEFWMSEVEALDSCNQHFGFTLHGSEQAFLLRFVYHNDVAAQRAATAIAAALQGAVRLESGLTDGREVDAA